MRDNEEDFFKKPGQLYFHHRFHVATAFLVFLVGMLVSAYSGSDGSQTVQKIGLGVMGIGFVWLLIAILLRARRE